MLGTALPLVSRLGDGIEALRKALVLDPLSAHYSGWLARFLLYAKDYPGAIAQGEKTLEIQDDYQRACILLAKNKIAALCFDPISQGERFQLLTPDGKPAAGVGTFEHTHADVGALLVGRCTASYEVWDGVRSVDYLASRPENARRAARRLAGSHRIARSHRRSRAPRRRRFARRRATSQQVRRPRVGRGGRVAGASCRKGQVRAARCAVNAGGRASGGSRSAKAGGGI